MGGGKARSTEPRREAPSRRTSARGAITSNFGANRKLRGWTGYFRLGTVRPAYRAVNQHVRLRMRQWLRGKHKLGRGAVCKRYPVERLHAWGLLDLERLHASGLLDLERLTGSGPWAKV